MGSIFCFRLLLCQLFCFLYASSARATNVSTVQSSTFTVSSSLVISGFCANTFPAEQFATALARRLSIHRTSVNITAVANGGDCTEAGSCPNTEGEACSLSITCSATKFCNYDSLDFGSCEQCAETASVDSCAELGLNAAGQQHCEAVCPLVSALISSDSGSSVGLTSGGSNSGSLEPEAADGCEVRVAYQFTSSDNTVHQTTVNQTRTFSSSNTSLAELVRLFSVELSRTNLTVPANLAIPLSPVRISSAPSVQHASFPTRILSTRALVTRILQHASLQHAATLHVSPFIHD
jgi:hypothetical protein